MHTPGIYLYCFARPGVLKGPTIPGVEEDQPLSLLELHQVAAIYSQVPLEDFRAQMEEKEILDPAWLIPRACRHEQIIAEIMGRSPVLPVRFGALFSSQQALEELLHSKGPKIAGFLDHIAGREEWAVKAIVDLSKAEAWLLDAHPDFSERYRRLPQTPGTRYFQEKRLRADLRKHLKVWASTTVAELLNSWQGLSDAFQPLTVQTPNAAAGNREMVFHGAFLVHRHRTADFRSRVEETTGKLAACGLIPQITGPWPPFHFCPSLEEASA